MLQRTRQWLLDRRDGQRRLRPQQPALDSFGGAPPDTTNAYVVWALLESGEKGLDKEIAAVKELGATTDDSYVVALAANVAARQGDKAAAKKLMDRLLKKQAQGRPGRRGRHQHHPQRRRGAGPGDHRPVGPRLAARPGLRRPRSRSR